MGSRKETENNAAPVPASGCARRIFFVAFKWVRISTLLLLLVVVVLGLFLNRFGLPVSFQRQIRESAKARGWDLEFSRLRLRWYRGLVAENVALFPTNASTGPHFFVETAELDPNLRALRHFRLQLDAVRLNGGRVVWPIAPTNEPAGAFTLEKLRGELLFRPNDEWELRSLDAVVLGARAHVRGNITNASFLRDWKFPARVGKPEAGPLFLNRLARQARRLHFDQTPELTGIFSCDARQPESLEAAIKLIANQVESRWTSLKDVRLTGVLVPPPAQEQERQTEFKLQIAEAQGRWGAVTNLDVTCGFTSSFTNWPPTNGTVTLALKSIATPWASLQDVMLKGRRQPASETADVCKNKFELTTSQARGTWGTVSQLRATGDLVQHGVDVFPATVRARVNLATPELFQTTADQAQVSLEAALPVLTNIALFRTNLLWPDRWTNLSLHAVTTLSNIAIAQIVLNEVRLTNRWDAPVLRSELSGQMGDGRVNGSVDLHLPEHRLDFKTAGVLPLESLLFLAGTNAQRVLAGHSTETLPRFQAMGKVTLPAWTNHAPDWNGEVLPTLFVSGMLDATNGAYRGVSYDAISALFEFTNLFLRAPEIRIVRPEGLLQGDLGADIRTGAIRCRLKSTIDPKALAPILSASQKSNTLDLFEFTRPPVFDAVLHAACAEGRLLGLDADAALTNFTFRTQEISACTARVLYTNGLVSILHPLVQRPGERGEAAGIGIVLDRRRLYLTNATGNLAAHAIAKAIGPITYRDVSPYIFDVPPQARVEGSVPIGHSDLTENMQFDIDGGPFHWRKFTFDRIRGTALWRSNTVTLTNIQARWCGGDMGGWLFVDFRPTNTDLLSFYAIVHEASLRAIVRQMNPSRTNRLEGLLSGELNILRADVNDEFSWMGDGYMHLTNGLVWDIPLFGVFSPVLNAFIPGLGNSRARHADTTFGITNSVIQTHDLEIRATMMRMQFKGTVDFGEHVEGRMEAELLRDVPGVGLVISKMLWPVTKLFEYKVTGKLANPRTEQVYAISKILLFPFQPIKTLRDLFREEGNAEDSILSPANPPR
jgi:hypothetical protein